jgi:hypothetical protein
MSSDSRKKIGKTSQKATRKIIRKAALAIAQGHPVRHAMRKAGFAATTSDKNQGVLLNNPIYKEERGRLRAALLDEDKDIFKKVAKRMTEGLSAKETKFFQYEGMVQESRDVVSWSERRQYAELIAKVFGELQPADEGRGGMTLNIDQLAILITQAREARGLAT